MNAAVERRAAVGPTDKWNGRRVVRHVDLGGRVRGISLNLWPDSLAMLVTIADGQFPSEK